MDRLNSKGIFNEIVSDKKWYPQIKNCMTQATLVYSWVATQSRPHTNAIPDKKRERKRMPEVKTGLAS